MLEAEGCDGASWQPGDVSPSSRTAGDLEARPWDESFPRPRYSQSAGEGRPYAAYEAAARAAACECCSMSRLNTRRLRAIRRDRNPPVRRCVLIEAYSRRSRSLTDPRGGREKSRRRRRACPDEYIPEHADARQREALTRGANIYCFAVLSARQHGMVSGPTR
jgi:hypothetical protein